MMIASEIKRWLQTISDDNSIAIDDGGLTLLELDVDGKETGANLAVGGIPIDDDEAE